LEEFQRPYWNCDGPFEVNLPQGTIRTGQQLNTKSGGSLKMTGSCNYIFWVAVCLIPSFIIPSNTVFACTQNLSSKITQWFVPLDIGNHLKIKCYDGSFVEFVSECTPPKACQSLLDSGNNTLECIPNSKFGITSEQHIFP
jgi:hypothetical protein